jgi:putative RecB family exonuclease
MPKYSHTMLATYEECPQKYQFRYIDGIQRPHENIENFVGTLVHRTLAKLYADLKESKLNTSQELLVFYEQQWKAEYGPHVRIVRRDMTAGAYFAAGKEMISTYYRTHQASLDASETLGLEIEVSAPLRDDTEFYGVVDRLGRSGERSLEIHDYKTSRRLPSQRDLENDRQLTMYELALRYQRPEVETVTLVWHYLRFGREIRLQKTKRDLHAAKQHTLRVIQQIEAARTFPTKESVLCGWCEYYQICPAKRGATRVPSHWRGGRPRHGGGPWRTPKRHRSSVLTAIGRLFGTALRAIFRWLREPW